MERQRDICQSWRVKMKLVDLALVWTRGMNVSVSQRSIGLPFLGWDHFKIKSIVNSCGKWRHESKLKVNFDKEYEILIFKMLHQFIAIIQNHKAKPKTEGEFLIIFICKVLFHHQRRQKICCLRSVFPPLLLWLWTKICSSTDMGSVYVCAVRTPLNLWPRW